MFPSTEPGLTVLGHTVFRVSLVPFQFFIHAAPIVALFRVGTNLNACLEFLSQHVGIHGEIPLRDSEHHLPHVVYAVPASLPSPSEESIEEKQLDNDDDVAPDDVELES